MKRGEVYYVREGSDAGGGYYMHTGRPAVVVSSDEINENAKIVEIVFLTTQPKRMSPNHVSVYCKGRLATALCEQITSIDIDNFADRMDMLSAKDMFNISKALANSLALGEPVSTVPEEHVSEDVEEYKKLAEFWKKKYLKQLEETMEMLK